MPLVGICAGVSGVRHPYRDPSTSLLRALSQNGFPRVLVSPAKGGKAPIFGRSTNAGGCLPISRPPGRPLMISGEARSKRPERVGFPDVVLASY